MKPLFIFIAFFMGAESQASSLKASKTFSSIDYTDISVSGTWKTGDSAYVVTSVQNTVNYGDKTNEYTLGFGNDINDNQSFYLSGYFRSEPENTRAMGLSPSLTHSFDEGLMEDQDTSLTLSVPVSRYSTDVITTNNKSREQSFYSIGGSVDLSQDITDPINLSVGGSYYVYSDKIALSAADAVSAFTSTKSGGGGGGGNSKKQKRRGRRLSVLNPSDNLLSSYGYPEYNLYISSSWTFLSSWNTSYSFSSSTATSTGNTSYYSSVGITVRPCEFSTEAQ